VSEFFAVVRELKEPLLFMAVALLAALVLLYALAGPYAVFGALLGGLLVAVPSTLIRLWLALRRERRLRA
jgi:F0F1-type ATP synthase assembly protein I